MEMKIKAAEYVEIPADKVRQAIAAAYDLSRPVGMGILHARSGPLDEATIDEIIARGELRGGPSMDYVHGRQCKFRLYTMAGRYYALPQWFDHSHGDFVELLSRIGISDGAERIRAATDARAA